MLQLTWSQADAIAKREADGVLDFGCQRRNKDGTLTLSSDDVRRAIEFACFRALRAAGCLRDSDARQTAADIRVGDAADREHKRICKAAGLAF